MYNHSMPKHNLKPIDLSKLLLPYENKWVALSEDQKQILGAGDTLKAAKKEAERKGRRYLFLKVPPFNLSYIPFGK